MNYRDFSEKELCELGKLGMREASEWFVEFMESRKITTFIRIRLVDYGDFNYLDKNTKSLRVICSGEVENDGLKWVHVSCSRRGRLPSWDDLKKVKHVFIGRSRKAIQILPPEAQYVNFHPYTLHLWTCLDGDPLPDLRKDGMI